MVGFRILAVASALALGGCAMTHPKHAGDRPEARGRVVAQRQCGACHAVEPGAVSPRGRAPAFASLEMQHTAGLEGRVDALTRQGHYGMPPVKLTPGEVADLVAYIASLGPR